MDPGHEEAVGMNTAATIAGVLVLAVLFVDYRLLVRRWEHSDD